MWERAFLRDVLALPCNEAVWYGYVPINEAVWYEYFPFHSMLPNGNTSFQTLAVSSQFVYLFYFITRWCLVCHHFQLRNGNKFSFFFGLKYGSLNSRSCAHLSSSLRFSILWTGCGLSSLFSSNSGGINNILHRYFSNLSDCLEHQTDCSLPQEWEISHFVLKSII